MTTGKSKAEPAVVAAWRRRWRPAAEGARLYGMVMLGGAYTLRMNEHVRVDVFYGRYGARARGHQRRRAPCVPPA